MRIRAPILGAAALVTLLAACDEAATTTVAGIRGAHDLALVDDLLFVTATDNNELRVLDLSNPRLPQWVSAPNPLHPLSIPVVERPVQLARDVLWREGFPRSGRYVYALSANSQSISVVGAFRESLREVATLYPVLNEAGSQGTITSIAARGDEGDGFSRLYIAIFQGDGSTLYEMKVPSEGVTPELGASIVRTPVASFDCGAILGMVVLPEGQLAYGGRRAADQTGCAPGGATAFLLDTRNGQQTPLNFGGPVRKLFTQPHAGPGHLAAAARIFGVLDEQSCEQGLDCRGVVAVVGPAGDPRSATDCGRFVGDRACDATLHPMTPVDVGGALIMGADVAANTSIVLPAAAVSTEGAFLQGVLTTSDGFMYFWDVGSLRHYDVDDARAEALALTLRGPDGTPLPYVPGPVPGSITVNEGIVRPESIDIIYRRALPEFSGVMPAAGASVTEILVPVDPTGVVEVGDRVLVISGECTPTNVGVSAVAPRPEGGGTLTLDAPLSNPAGDCAIAVHPSETSAAPWVAVGRRTGYLGRFAPGAVSLPTDPERIASLYYWHPPSLETGAPVPLPPLLSMEFQDPFAAMDPMQPPLTPQPGYWYELETRANFQPATVTVDPAWAGGQQFRADVAGPAVFRHGAGTLYVGFPSGEVVLQFRVNGLIAGSATREAEPFR